MDISTFTVPHTLTLEVTLNSNYDEPSIFLIGAVALRSTAAVTANPGAAGDTNISLSGLSGSIITSPSPTFVLPTALIPAGEAVGPAPNPFGNPTLRFGGLCIPRLVFSADMPTVGAVTDTVVVKYGATTVLTLDTTALSATAGCKEFKTPLPFGAAMVGFDVTIDTARAVPSVVVIDSVIATVISPTLETVSPINYTPSVTDHNLLITNPGFESGPSGWTVSNANTPDIVLTPADVIKTSPVCGGGYAAVFDPAGMPAPPINLYTWARVAAAGGSADTLTLDITDRSATAPLAPITGRSVLDGGGAVSATYGMLKLADDLSAWAGRSVTITFTGLTGTGTTTPTVFVMGSAQLSNKTVAGPDPDVPADFASAAFAQSEDAYLTANILAPSMMWTGTSSSYLHPVRFGGIHQPSLKYQVSAPVKGDSGDTLEMLFGGVAEPLATVAGVTANCLKQEKLLPSSWLGKSGAFGFRSTIKEQTGSTVFELDDLCITHVSDALNAVNSGMFPLCDMAALSESFDPAAGTWTAESSLGTVTSTYIGSSTETAPACDTTNVAVFKALDPPAVQTATLSQTALQVPWQTKDLTFYLKSTGGGKYDSFAVVTTLAGVDATVFTVQGDDTAYAGAYKQVTVSTMSPYAGQTLDAIKFVAKLADKTVASSFALDSICLAPPAGSTALFTVDSGSGAVTMSNIALQGGSTGVAVTGGASLDMYRCLVQGASNTGVQLVGGTLNMASCSLYGNGVGVGNAGGLANIFQTTVQGSTTSISGTGGTTRAAACLCSGGGIAGTGITTYINWVTGNNFTGENSTLKNLVVADYPVTITNTDWPGRLDPATVLQSGVAKSALAGAGFAVPSQWTTDFEGDGRSSTSLGVGADEQLVGITGISGWTITSVSPGVTGPNTVPVHIEFATQGGDLTVGGSTAKLRLAPQMPALGTTGDVSADGTYLLWDVKPITATTGSADVTFSSTFVQPSGFCVDGVMSIGLEEGGVLVPLLPVSTGPTTFIVDTIPPVLQLNSLSVSPAPAPTAWSGAVSNLQSGDLHVFINPNANTNQPYEYAVPPLAITCAVTATFADRQPVDGNGATWAVTPSGFKSLTVPSATLPDTNRHLLSDTTASPGTAWLGGVVSNINDVTDATAIFTAGGTNSEQLTATWAAVGVQTGGDDPWNMAVTPVAVDRANNPSLVNFNGNLVSLGHALKIWWMYRVKAQISGSSTDGTQTSTPHFEWSALPGARPPESETPTSLRPSAWFKVWYASTATGPWTPLTDDWGQTFARTIDGSTPVVVDGTAMTLREALLDNRRDVSKGKVLRIGVLGQDEAGNVQPKFAAIPANLNASGIDSRTWTNGTNQGNVGVDTDVTVQLSHVKPTGNVPFGGVLRVPLPLLSESRQGAYVNARVCMTAQYPELLKTATSQLYNKHPLSIEWRLYEEGTLVAQGRVYPDLSSGQVQFDLPGTTLKAGVFDNIEVDAKPVPWAFLHQGPDGLKNRLGDEVSPAGVGRQRELKYTFVAQTVATIYVADSANGANSYQTISDPTPASAEFSIYVKEMADKIREEQPVRIYERN